MKIKQALLGVAIATAAINVHASDSIKVFFLAGQSNMVGNGNVETGTGSLRDQVNTNPAKYGHLVDAFQDWTTRPDVWVWSRTGNASGAITTDTTGDLGVAGNTFGPEVGIGKVLGDHYDEQVVLIKTAWGGKSLYQDFRPPSAGPIPTEITDYLDANKKDASYGTHYNLMVNAMQEALSDVATRYAGQTIEIEGLLWHQGWNDRANLTQVADDNTRFAGLAVPEYESNLNHLIADLRSALETPDLKVVIGTSGMGDDSIFDPANRENPNFKIKPNAFAQDLVAAQLAVGDADANAAAVDTHPFWRDASVSPANQIEHWNRNGESYYLIGESMGEAMVTLVPEPSSLGLLALGGLVLMRRRRHA
jgi:alpha-galactosidase